MWRSPRIPFLVNGSPTSPITTNRGLVGESLNKLVEKLPARELGVVKGFEVSQNGSVVTHLQFKDGTLFFCDPSRSKVLGFQAVLRCF